MRVQWVWCLLLGLIVVSLRGAGAQPADLPCVWSSLSGATYDLSSLTVTEQDQEGYNIRDGDIPCTTETEPTYSFSWNFCYKVTNASVPLQICGGKRGAAMQYLNRSDGWHECHVIGRYDASQDDTHYSLLDITDPSKGVSIRYSAGEKCPSGVLRTATIDVSCSDTRVEILSALEPQTCQYHMVMKSYYGCPKECPITQNGLCNSHGHCAYDSKLKQPYCYCNWGWSGSECSTFIVPAAASGAAHSVQIGLLVMLVVIAAGLIGVVGFMVLKITAYRKEQVASYSFLQLSQSSSHGAEGLVELQSF